MKHLTNHQIAALKKKYIPAVIAVLKIVVTLACLGVGLTLWLGFPIALTAIGMLFLADIVSDHFMKP